MKRKILVMMLCLACAALQGQPKPNVAFGIDKATKAKEEERIRVEDARRDEYFSNVQISIDDKKRNLRIEKPYEQLTLEQKRFYLGTVPEKLEEMAVVEEVLDPVSESGNIFHIDDRKVSLEELKRFKGGFVYSGGYTLPMKVMDNGASTTWKYAKFFYTRSYFEKNVKHILDHHPDKLYTVKIDPVPGDWPVKDEEGDAETSPLEHLKKPDFISFNYPGGMVKFFEYFCNNVNLPNGNFEEMWIFFDVNVDGSLTCLVPDENNQAFSLEIMRVVQNSPLWMPGQKNGKALKISTGIRISLTTDEPGGVQTVSMMYGEEPVTFLKKIR
jgi:hypothetical protein|nr:hypothetical protein [uncultured Flavobacterium sp.]